ncbi:MAG: hypothetical protein KTR28_08130 [Micavibrio sp.]|nr:hypothetical protein [Micavibrio sp.]
MSFFDLLEKIDNAVTNAALSSEEKKIDKAALITYKIHTQSSRKDTKQLFDSEYDYINKHMKRAIINGFPEGWHRRRAEGNWDNMSQNLGAAVRIAAEGVPQENIPSFISKIAHNPAIKTLAENYDNPVNRSIDNLLSGINVLLGNSAPNQRANIYNRLNENGFLGNLFKKSNGDTRFFKTT